MFKEHDEIVVTEDVSGVDAKAKAGAIGVIVDMYPDAFLVEFDYGDIRRCDLITILPHQARLATEEDFQREKNERKAGVAGT